LVNNSGHACLADFSLLTMASDQSSIMPSSLRGRNYHWMAPELLNPDMFGLDGIHLTEQSDCYALGMVIYEVLCGKTPFAPHKAPVVVSKVLKGERPGRPHGEGGVTFTDSIWRVLEYCWKHQSCDRISAKTILQGLEGNEFVLMPTSPEVDRDMEHTSNSSDTTESGSSVFFSSILF